MRVLIACEFSGTVRRAFAALGHDAWSCDLLPADDGGPHLLGDVLPHLADGWNLMIAHPPCTYLASSGIHWNARRPERAARGASGGRGALEGDDGPGGLGALRPGDIVSVDTTVLRSAISGFIRSRSKSGSSRSRLASRPRTTCAIGQFDVLQAASARIAASIKASDSLWGPEYAKSYAVNCLSFFRVRSAPSSRSSLVTAGLP